MSAPAPLSPAGAPAPSPSRHLWGDRSVKTKVLGTVAVGALVTGVVGFMGLQALGASADAADDLYASNLRGIAAAGEMDVLVGDLRINIRDTVVGADPAASVAAIDTIAAEFRAAAEAYRATTDGDTGKVAALDEIVADAEAYVTFQQGVLVPLSQVRDFESWMQQNATQGAPLAQVVQDGIDGIREVESDEAAAVAARIRADYESQRTLAIVLMLAGIAVTAGLGFWIATGIARQAARVGLVTAALSRGDLTVRAGLDTRDELGEMGQALDAAVVELRGVMATVVGAADAVAASSEELSASSAQISASAEETSAQSGVVAGAADEVSRSVQTVAAGAEQMGASIREIASNAAEASEVAGRAVAAAETTTATVAKLGDSSAEIGNVVKVITSIAEQTNLLALNATIEAARAGEAGKGFAVVANEVKELAQETAKATEDIARRVQAIQGDTTAAVAAIGEISSIVAQIADRQTTIASAVEEQTATTNEMARSVSEAAQGSGQIADNITGVSTAAESTTQALTQTRTAVDELSRMAADLRTTVGRFRY
ncbi:methyl-accepting chemotaxis protein [Trujillonella humicola]|uniref:methyl-accepting chemotaxis protein n=1 Tax=Trujillonella humicola TaxID=3383699 RepID=UPI0039066A82